ncbi:CDP-glucose 4,6-dehydratase [Ruminiclostridium sufflavum DSM 19573]|uniref:CDP-glucose 4,6-dehydratase n=1 Tax=Ruminiclostridium sufflavum DSM 19573 TaxID=1121337 RepID=A0A318XY74_9FIRM|nr:CDP-glucose 4,6-dehydratase [Ruminiclostridium sufflavum]PYG87793.1 CDP-glucose 4,6-dehydratase [Ruminiclostridium sufflavum DSM 19573]
MESVGITNLSFFKNKKVFITGHTGFKGTWLCKLLINAGAQITGYSLEPPENPSFFSMLRKQNHMNSVIGDVRNSAMIKKIFNEAEPEIAIHLAAQPIVRASYENPQLTYETNVMGTVNFLECIRESQSVKSVLNVTTDKVYQNKEWEWGYRENERLNGYDPYSNSKSCSELVTQSYKNAFFQEDRVRLSTARAGNVIGGGDFSNDRIIPDCVRAAIEKTNIIVRNYSSVRPYQHVLEPLNAYLLIVQKQYLNKKYAGCYNVGPDECDCVTTEQLVKLFCEKWGENLTWTNQHDGGPHEASFLKLDCSKIKKALGWKPVWNIEKAVEKTVEWTKAYLGGSDTALVMDEQIKEFFR